MNLAPIRQPDHTCFTTGLGRITQRFATYAATSPQPLPAPGLIVTPEIRLQSELYLPINEIRRLFYRLYVHAVQEQTGRVERLTNQIQELIPQWQLAQLVKALQALRGVSLIVASTTAAELGDLTRFIPEVDGLYGDQPDPCLRHRTRLCGCRA